LGFHSGFISKTPVLFWLVVLKHFLISISYMGCHPSHFFRTPSFSRLFFNQKNRLTLQAMKWDNNDCPRGYFLLQMGQWTWQTVDFALPTVHQDLGKKGGPPLWMQNVWNLFGLCAPVLLGDNLRLLSIMLGDFLFFGRWISDIAIHIINLHSLAYWKWQGGICVGKELIFPL
jgi:hypothetical protein